MTTYTVTVRLNEKSMTLAFSDRRKAWHEFREGVDKALMDTNAPVGHYIAAHAVMDALWSGQAHALVSLGPWAIIFESD